MRKVYLEFSSTGIKVPATVVENSINNDKKLVDKFWDAATRGEEYACVYTLIAGYCFLATPKPGPTYPYIEPETKLNIFEAVPGQIHFDGHKIRCTYGPCTEPLPVPYALVATVDPEYVNDWIRACQDVWNNGIYTHKLVTITMTRKED